MDTKGTFILVILLLFTTHLTAGSIFLNGVKIDGVIDQEFKGVNIKIDREGNIHISAPQYIVKFSEESEKKRVAPTHAKAYFLVTQISKEGRGGYDIDIFINNNWVKKIINKDEQIVMDISKYMQNGKNTIRLTGIKAKDEVPSPQSMGFTEIIIGEGTAGKNNVVIDKPLIDLKFNAKESNPVIKDFEIEAMVK